MEDQAYRALSDGRRRAVLLALIGQASISVPSLLSREVSASDRVALRHKHLPMLATMGYLTWKQASGVVERGPRFDTVRNLVEFHAAEYGDAATSDAGTVD